MNMNQKYLKRSLMVLGTLLIMAAIFGMVSGASVQSAQAAPKKTRTPTRTASATPSQTPISTPTQTPAPFSTPTPGPTTTVNGTWKIVSSPNVGTGTYGNQLSAVTVVSANDVWAVGFSPHPSGTPLYIRQTLIEHWNGSSWNVVPSPNPAGKTWVVLNGVDSVSASDIWAVGYSQWSYFSGYRYAPVTYHWDGTRWNLIPNAGSIDEFLHAVTAIAPNDAWAVGDNGQTQHWNGADWSRVAAPYPGLGGRFNGIAAASASDVWAVGSYSDGNQWLTWIDRYTVP